MIVAASLLPVAIWAYLLFGRGWFWLCRERDDSAAAAAENVPRERAAFGSNRHREDPRAEARGGAAIQGVEAPDDSWIASLRSQ